jgi:hypothetical protein
MQNEADTKQLRTFALLVGGIFAVIGLWPVLWRGEALRLWAVLLSVGLVVPGVVWPRSLGPVYRGWMLLGHVLGWINTRILLGIIFFGLITPMGLVRRLLGKDSMRRSFEPEVDTYRVVREPRPSSHLTRPF